ncbi:Arginyl-tRNA--protein transferase 1 [Lucilia cuprina]|uniref:Arginyl-tRNA--protein transferase 1 n=1 Tax=Lucilia cuprina TaxID=7375 RepID=A0A0L0CIZ0_LUCCU|nr:Arginyl-tRNA--protein transferase 1 [Lucilia cuprina]
MDFSIIEYYGKQESKCGYCKGIKCSIGHGMHAYTMSPADYQDLIDRGWRRSGHYCYKQDNTTTCCPCYTIKCDALEFKLSKSHKKVLKRMNRFLRDGKRDKNEELQTTNNTDKEAKDNDNEDVGDDAGGGGIREEVQGPNVPLKDINLELFAKANGEHNNVKDNYKEKEISQAKDIKDKTETNEESSSGSKKSLEGVNPPCKKAKQMRLERKLAKNAAKGLATDLPLKTPRDKEKTLKDLINDNKPDDKHKLKIVLVPSNKDIYTETALALYRKYQLIIHNDNPERLQPKNLLRFLYNSPLKLEVIHVKSEQFHKTLPQTYELYKKYQTLIHNDPPAGEDDYLVFLQRSPLKLSKPADGPPSGYGSFHQQYWLDDKLIAVAVIDILPYCVSSVYFFYDPDYNFLSLGTYSSLREIELVQRLASIVPSLKYYYMGFYIHSCPKMRYKGRLSSSYLLCPETYTWHLLTDEIRSKLDANKYQRFNNDPQAKDVNEFKISDIDSVLLLINAKTYVKYRQYKQIAGNEERESIIEYSQLVGKTLAHRMLYLKF